MFFNDYIILSNDKLRCKKNNNLYLGYLIDKWQFELCCALPAQKCIFNIYNNEILLLSKKYIYLKNNCNNKNYFKKICKRINKCKNNIKFNKIINFDF